MCFPPTLHYSDNTVSNGVYYFDVIILLICGTCTLVKAMAALRMCSKWFSFFPPQLFFESTSRNKTLKGGTQYVYYTTTHTTFTFIVGRVLIAGHVVTEYGTYVASSLNPEVEGFGTEGGHTVCHVVLVMLLLTV